MLLPDAENLRQANKRFHNNHNCIFCNEFYPFKRFSYKTRKMATSNAAKNWQGSFLHDSNEENRSPTIIPVI
jgi:hypothetical protein